MKRIGLFSAMVLFICVGRVPAVELVGVHGSNTQYTTTMDVTISDKHYHLVLTGTALRQKFFFNVYTIGSYVLEGAAVHTAEELATIDQPKQLHRRGVPHRHSPKLSYALFQRRGEPSRRDDARNRFQEGRPHLFDPSTR